MGGLLNMKFFSFLANLFKKKPKKEEEIQVEKKIIKVEKKDKEKIIKVEKKIIKKVCPANVSKDIYELICELNEPVDKNAPINFKDYKCDITEELDLSKQNVYKGYLSQSPLEPKSLKIY